MKAGRLLAMFQDKDPNADVYVNIEGDLIPVVSARYDPGKAPRVVLGLDRLQVLLLLEKLKMGAEEEDK